MLDDQSSFWNDLRNSAAAWARFPWLPAVSVALTGGSALFDGVAWPLGLCSLLFTAGWIGTERICYLRAFRGRPITVGEVWRMTRSFILRYALLGAVLSLLMVPAIIVLAVTTPASGSGEVDGFLLYASVAGFLMGVGCTFIMPALAFTTRRLRNAARIGVSMIRTEWPACAGYVLVPPIASLAIIWAVGPWNDADLVSRLITLTCAPLLNLLFKGATAAFYLRRWKTGDDGAAFVGRTPPAAPPPPSGDMQG